MVQPLKIGDTIADRYYLEEFLSGSENTYLFKCTDTRLDIANAIKILLPTKNTTPQQLQQLTADFIEVSKKQARLKHPNIVHIVNIDSRQGLSFIVMELIHGQTLHEFTKENINLPLPHLFDILMPVVDAILIAHEENVIHKNLNASNIIISKHSNRYAPKVLNFAVNRNPQKLSTPDTLPFLSPEQFDNYDAATHKSDIFSLGALIYYTISNSLPYYENTHAALQKTYETGKPINPLPDYVPEPLRNIIFRCCQINPALRYENVSELMQELRDVASPIRESTAMPRVEMPTTLFDVPDVFDVEKHLKLGEMLAQNNDVYVFTAKLHDPQYRAMQFKTKFLNNARPDKKQSFINGVQIQQYLSQFSPYIQPVFKLYEDIPAYITIAENAHSLRDMVKNSGALDPKFAIHSFTFIAESLLTAQQYNYYHSSINPNNIFFTERDNYLVPTIYDFAQHAFCTTDIAEISLDNALFIAPELNYQKNIFTLPSEVYSFGMTLLYAVLGRSPFRAKSPQELKVEMLATQKTPNIAELMPDLHPSISQFINWCTDYYPNKRYNNFLNLYNDILAIGQMLQNS